MLKYQDDTSVHRINKTTEFDGVETPKLDESVSIFKLSTVKTTYRELKAWFRFSRGCS